MSTTDPGPEFDPRYDPRYQRGWGEGATDAGSSLEPDANGPGETGSPAASAADAAGSEGPAPEAAAPSGARSHGEPVTRPAEGEASAPAPPATAGSAPSAGGRAAADRADRIMRAALSGAWAVALLAVAVGAGLIAWRLTRGDDYYQTRGMGDMVLEALAFDVAPGLLAAGLVGAVVLIVVDGARRAFPGLAGPRPEAGTRP